MTTPYAYKLVREDASLGNQLVSLHPTNNVIVYPAYAGATIVPRAGGVFCFSSQETAVATMRRNIGLYRVWLFQCYAHGLVKIENCPKDGDLNNFERFWINFMWGVNESKNRNKKLIETYLLSRPPTGTVVTRRLEIIRPLYFQPVPEWTIYEPTDGDMDRIGWSSTERRRWH